MMRYPRLLSLLAIWWFFTLATAVPAAPDMDGSGEETGIGFWERSRGTVGDIWEKTLNAFRGSPEEELFAHLWKSMLPRMDSVLALEDRHASLPEQAWFGEDQQSNQAAIGDLLDESINILSDSNGSGYRERIRVVSGAIRSARSEISRLRDARVTAPADSMWQRTMEQYKAEIHKQQALIAQYQLEHAAIRRDFAADLRRQGLNISNEQLEFLLATVVGDHLVRLSEVFYNVKLLTVQLERLMLESHEDLSLARRYYGMYTVLLRVVERMHTQMIGSLDNRYLPQIDAIMGRARDLLHETRKLFSKAPAERRTLNANLEAQEFTLVAARGYRAYLQEQRASVLTARHRLEGDLLVATNTYETVKLSGELVTLVKSSRPMLDKLLNLQLPALRTFENLEMKREFEQFTFRLREGE